MIKGREIRRTEYPVDPLFLDRWSPRSMTGEDVSELELRTLLAAASWAPSSYNAQPWRMLYARRSTPSWPMFFDLLTEGNKLWAHRAAALIVFISKRLNDVTGKPSVTHSFDTGAAWGYFALQAHLKGYAAHGMQGFDYERARRDLAIPEAFAVEAMAAVGRPASKESLPAQLQERERPNGRRPLSETVCEGIWSLPG
ncbi:MAG TPA: nitroreductase family protein [Steroidobacteraceae bacterium]|nr:nitroreductase family protein [Steroidobacteraceae bacterium]